jgi:hypothetical protein
VQLRCRRIPLRQRTVQRARRHSDADRRAYNGVHYRRVAAIAAGCNYALEFVAKPLDVVSLLVFLLSGLLDCWEFEDKQENEKLASDEMSSRH